MVVMILDNLLLIKCFIFRKSSG